MSLLVPRRTFLRSAALGFPAIVGLKSKADVLIGAAIGRPIVSSGPTFRQVGALAGDPSAGGYSISPALPSGWQADDIHLLQVASSAAATYTGLGSWNFITEVDSTTVAAEWYWRRAVGGDAAPTIGVSAGASSAIWGQIIGYSNCITSGTPYEDATTAGSSSDTTPDTATVTATSTNRRAVCMLAVSDDLAWSAGSPPANWTERADAGDGSGDDAWFTFIEQTALVSNGDSTATTIGTLGGSLAWASITLLLIPA